MMSENLDLEFVLDSAATDQKIFIIFIKKGQFFKTFTSLKAKLLTAKGTTKIAGIGNINLVINSGTVPINLVLKNVYYAPDMCRNLISVTCLCL